jgi:hypothetical protein
MLRHGSALVVMQMVLRQFSEKLTIVQVNSQTDQLDLKVEAESSADLPSRHSEFASLAATGAPSDPSARLHRPRPPPNQASSQLHAPLAAEPTRGAPATHSQARPRRDTFRVYSAPVFASKPTVCVAHRKRQCTEQRLFLKLTLQVSRVHLTQSRYTRGSATATRGPQTLREDLVERQGRTLKLDSLRRSLWQTVIVRAHRILKYFTKVQRPKQKHREEQDTREKTSLAPELRNQQH